MVSNRTGINRLRSVYSPVALLDGAVAAAVLPVHVGVRRT